MKKYNLSYITILAAVLSFGMTQTQESFTKFDDEKSICHSINNLTMKLGAFSVSLSVKDLKASKQFYETLGFSVLAGDFEKNYFILKNENALIGIFHGMFENNILTFNPGWDESAQNIEAFDDVREIQKHLVSNGIALDLKADASTSGPANMMFKDPDGNIILIDQHR